MEKTMEDISTEEITDAVDELFLQRESFLSQYGCKENDVLQDDEGEFVFIEDESGSPGLDYSVGVKRVYVPESLSFTF